ncbi:uncharacterized protein LOC126298080 [Schistocerca gregaria]|uniref:uncharacterized protein LOC126298080 n=1 Tax=Schistocerca gregaria TaxID=7010 RepID=UPI00211E91EB|nr:uncharacterized protein LOC126298080 [Schistocerca gregaria]
MDKDNEERLEAVDKDSKERLEAVVKGNKEAMRKLRLPAVNNRLDEGEKNLGALKQNWRLHGFRHISPRLQRWPSAPRNPTTVASPAVVEVVAANPVTCTGQAPLATIKAAASPPPPPPPCSSVLPVPMAAETAVTQSPPPPPPPPPPVHPSIPSGGARKTPRGKPAQAAHHHRVFSDEEAEQRPLWARAVAAATAGGVDVATARGARPMLVTGPAAVTATTAGDTAAGPRAAEAPSVESWAEAAESVKPPILPENNQRQKTEDGTNGSGFGVACHCWRHLK